MQTKPKRRPRIGLLMTSLTLVCSSCFAAIGKDSSETELLQLAKSHFNNDLRPAEDTLFRAVESGILGDCNHYSIRADRLVWLCTDKKAAALVTFRGIRVSKATIEGNVELDWAKVPFPIEALSCTFLGAINLKNGSLFALSLEGSEIQNLEAERLTVDGNVFLRDGFKANGEVSLGRVKIKEDLDCRRGQFLNRSGIGLAFESAKIDGTVFLNHGFKAFRQVFLADAKIGGDLDCSDGHFMNTAGPALYVRGAKVDGRVLLNRNFEAKERVFLTGAKVGGSLDCTGGEFQSSRSFALQADYVDIKGPVLLRDNFLADGGVSLEHATVDGNLDCAKGQFRKGEMQPIAFELRAAKVAQDVHLDNGFRAEGIVSFRDVRVDHEFILKEIKSADKMILDLSFAKIASLLNDSQSWPERGNLSLQGFVYDVIDKDAKSDASTQVQWLDRQSRLEFLSQPYEQLAVVLRNMGLQEESVKVMIAKNEDHGRYAKGWDWWWYNVFGKVIGYGYRPWDALWPSLFFVGIGTVLFWRGFRSKILMPKDEKTYEAYKKDQPTESYPSFNCFIYSLETFVPLVKLGINEYWVPNSNLGDDVIFLVREFALRFAFGAYATKPVRDEFAPLKASGQLATRNPFKVGGLLRWYLWFHILVGWILTTLLLGGLTGLLKT